METRQNGVQDRVEHRKLAWLVIYRELALNRLVSKPSRAAIVVAVALAASAVCEAQSTMKDTRLSVRRVVADFAVSELENPRWRNAEPVTVGRYWSGSPAPAGRHFETRLLWSENALYVRFEAAQSEPLIVSEKPNVFAKALGLWDRDVCEIFIAPDAKEPRKYFEFEIAPNGEWIDLGIDLTSGTRVTDWDYKSGMESAAKIEKERIVMAIKVPWKALGKTPKEGNVWLGNLFRCVGKDPNRGYLAWRPTMTAEPSFHVPEKFGEFEFVK